MFCHTSNATNGIFHFLPSIQSFSCLALVALIALIGSSIPCDASNGAWRWRTPFSPTASYPISPAASGQVIGGGIAKRTRSRRMRSPTRPKFGQKRKHFDIKSVLASVLSHSRACVPEDTWEDLDLEKFLEPGAVDDLVAAGLACAELNKSGSADVDWDPDKNTAKLLERENVMNEEEWLEVLKDETLVWTGHFRPGCYGSAHPVIRSRGIVDGMSPKELAELIMDSSRVNVYNKMSLGREDVRVLQTGVDTHDPETGRRGETKIVKNVTKPPLTKKMLEFVTLMHARRLGGGEEGLEGSEGYLIVSRAISVSSGDRNSYDDKKSKVVRSEILLGVNIMRSVKGRDDATELVAVTHVNSPLTPMMMAQKLGKKGAVDFLRDIRIAASGLMQ